MKNLSTIIYILVFLFGHTILLSAQVDRTKEATKEKSRSNLVIGASIEKLATCTDSEDGIIKVAVKGGQEPYQLIELVGKEKTAQLQEGLLFTKLDADVYTLRVVDANGLEKTSQITVNAINPAPFADFEVTAKKEKLHFINTSYQAGRWKWIFENGQVSTEASPTIQLVEKIQEVCLKVSNGCNHTETYCEVINVKDLLNAQRDPITQPTDPTITDLTNTLKEYQVTVYPNPTVNRLTISYAEQMQVQTIEIFNVVGKLLESIVPQTSTQTELLMGQYPAGVYLVQVSGVSSKTFKVKRKE